MAQTWARAVGDSPPLAIKTQIASRYMPGPRRGPIARYVMVPELRVVPRNSTIFLTAMLCCRHDITGAILWCQRSASAAFVRRFPMSTVPGDGVGDFVPDDTRVLYDICFPAGQPPSDLAFELAGARESCSSTRNERGRHRHLWRHSAPGINNVIRTLFFELVSNYGVREVLGIRFGYQGLNPQEGKPPIQLTAEWCDEIHHMGGTILGTSRGPQDVDHGGFLAGARRSTSCFASAATARSEAPMKLPRKWPAASLPIAVVGVPKTIDNDIAFCQPHVRFRHGRGRSRYRDRPRTYRGHRRAQWHRAGEAHGSRGRLHRRRRDDRQRPRQFRIDPRGAVRAGGYDGLLAKLERRLAAREHAVIVVAEGAGQNLLARSRGSLRRFRQSAAGRYRRLSQETD